MLRRRTRRRAQHPKDHFLHTGARGVDPVRGRVPSQSMRARPATSRSGRRPPAQSTPPEAPSSLTAASSARRVLRADRVHPAVPRRRRGHRSRRATRGPALTAASPGEFVVNADATADNLPILDAINCGLVLTSGKADVTSAALASGAGGAQVLNFHFPNYVGSRAELVETLREFVCGRRRATSNAYSAMAIALTETGCAIRRPPDRVASHDRRLPEALPRVRARPGGAQRRARQVLSVGDLARGVKDPGRVLIEAALAHLDQLRTAVDQAWAAYVDCRRSTLRAR